MRVLRGLLCGCLLAAVAATLYLAGDEVQSSRLQAEVMSGLAGDLRFAVAPGPSDAIRFPGPGPYDQRLGYWQLPLFIDRLTARDYAVTAQARLSPRMLELSDSGLFAIYRESSQGGLQLLDRRGEPLHAARIPQRAYGRFDSVPPLLVDALLFIENRELLDPTWPQRNPAVEWDRLANAALARALRVVNPLHAASGGSTLATQIEKYRHSPEGRTESMREKLRQMASASLRAYLDGEDTLGRRRQIVADYIDTVPLSAQVGIGEVNGLGDGLWAWYGRDFDEVNRLLSRIGDAEPPWPPRPLHGHSFAFRQALMLAQALAFKQALSLLVAQRRPSHYLRDRDPDLAALTDSHLRVMTAAGVISPALRDAALPIHLNLLPKAPAQLSASMSERKATAIARNRLSVLLDMPRAYDLDRLDLTVNSTIDGQTQRTITRRLRELKDPAAARAAGLYGFRLLKDGNDPGQLVFSFTLFERGAQSNLLRVQTDSTDQPFDVNEGARLDLGSTAKLRTLITYLELVAALHERWAGQSNATLAAAEVHDKDALGRWARDYLLHTPHASLATMLEAAMERRYSASPGESFFTGGSGHRFVNFDYRDDARVLSVREALRRSVNLVFIRLMRDVVHHFIYAPPEAAAALLAERTDAARHKLLARFADKEGREYIARFHARYRSMPPALLADRASAPGMHPLEMWLVEFLHRRPGATLGDAIAASRDERQQTYVWLFKTASRQAQDARIRVVLELDAFARIQRAWQRLGYPFESLTPSYATAIGASGDRPAALAELMGIVANQGMRLPTAGLDSLAFARNTPYETRLDYRPPGSTRVLPAEVARTVRRVLVEVVEDGTARRLKGAFVLRDGRAVEAGGKTGTGDHRFDVHGKGGRLISSRIVGRTATLAFVIGERHFGTLMVYAGEPYAAGFAFTSALPAQLLKSLAPALLPLIEEAAPMPPDAP